MLEGTVMRGLGFGLGLVALAVLGTVPAAGAVEADAAGNQWEVAGTVYVPSPDGPFAATGGLAVLSADDGSLQQVPVDYLPFGVAYAPDARTLYTLGYSNRLPVFVAHDAATGEVLWAETVAHAELSASWAMIVAVSPDGSVAMTTGSGETRVDLATHAVEPFQACSTSIALSVAITPDGTRAWFVCSVEPGAEGTELRAFDLATLDLVETLRIPDVRSTGIAITPDGATALLPQATRVTPTPARVTLRVDLATGAVTELAERTNGRAAFSPDGARAYVGTSDFDAAGAANPGEIDLLDDARPPVELAPDGGGGQLHTLDVASMSISASVPFATDDANPVIAPDGALLYAISLEYAEGVSTGGISTRDAAGLDSIRETPTAGLVSQLAITPDQAPVAQLTASEPHSPVTFDASASTVEFGTIAEYAWDFGDGTTTVTSTPVVQHEYASAGQYTATVRLTSSGGTSTEDVYTGQQLLRNGDPSAIATVVVTVPRTLPATGFDGAWIAAVAGALLLIGAIVFVAAERRRARR